MTPAGTAPVRCPWPGIEAEIYAEYHDTEWGVPKLGDRELFEKLILEGFQSGLSWLTILRKRENFRAAFAGFEVERMPMPGDVIHGGELLPAIYMNYLVGNGFVLGMAFGEPRGTTTPRPIVAWRC